MIDNSGINRTGLGRTTGFERDATFGETDDANVDTERGNSATRSSGSTPSSRFRPPSPVRRESGGENAAASGSDDGPSVEDLPPSILTALGREYIDRRAAAGTLSSRQATELRRDPELMLHVGTTLGDGSDPLGRQTVDALIVADEDTGASDTGLEETAATTSASPPDVEIGTHGSGDAVEVASSGAASSEAAAAPQGTSTPEDASSDVSIGDDDAASRQRNVERGGEYVGSLLESGALTGGRAIEILADTDVLALIGALAGDRTDPLGVRAAEVLITDVGTSLGEADRHLSGLARSGALDPTRFRALANDGEFIDDLVASLHAAPSASTERLLDQALANLDAGRSPTAGADERFVSRDGLPFVRTGEPLAASDTSAFAYVTADGRFFPTSVQRALDATSGSASGIPAPLLRGAQVLAGDGEPTAAERLAAFSIEHGLSDLDTYLERLGDDVFLANPSAARAADVLFGTGPDAPTSAERTLVVLYKGGHIDLATFVEQADNPALHAVDAVTGEDGSLAYRTENLKPGGAPAPETEHGSPTLTPARRELLAEEALTSGLFATAREPFDRELFTSGLDVFTGLGDEDRDRLLGAVDARLVPPGSRATEHDRSHADLTS